VVVLKVPLVRNLDDESAESGERDRLLLRLLKTPPKQRPKRDRERQKSNRKDASRASGEKPESSA
jgi:hypothetical protein